MNRRELRAREGLQLLALATLIVLALLGYLKVNAHAEATRGASRDVAECRRLVAEIDQLQQLPQFAALAAESSSSIGERIELATQAARLPAAALIRIQPQSPFRLGNSEYRLWPTRLELNQVTLQQITTFAHALVDERRGLTVRDLRLWTTISESRASTQETWSAEITLTQVTFFPRSR